MQLELHLNSLTDIGQTLNRTYLAVTVGHTEERMWSNALQGYYPPPRAKQNNKNCIKFHNKTFIFEHRIWPRLQVKNKLKTLDKILYI
jgi:hypothetical protein